MHLIHSSIDHVYVEPAIKCPKMTVPYTANFTFMVSTNGNLLSNIKLIALVFSSECQMSNYVNE